jgi:hypothetical protein
MSKKPFESYSLYRGKKNALFGSTYKSVGLLKGLIRVTFDPNEHFFSKEVITALLHPRAYKVRLYVLDSFHLAMTDRNLDGSEAPPDPYLKVSLGDFKFDDRKNAVYDMSDCPFYKMIEIDAMLPGSSQLILDVYDKDTLGGDDLIGTTVIDLEDRCFDKDWQALGAENLRTEAPVRWKTKPMEYRTLKIPGLSLPRGYIQIWVDILPPGDAVTFPPDDVSLPPTQMFEMRVVIWKAKDVPAMDSLENMR